MKVRFYRKLALLMAGCLVFGSIRLTGITVQASQMDGDADIFHFFIFFFPPAVRSAKQVLPRKKTCRMVSHTTGIPLFSRA